MKEANSAVQIDRSIGDFAYPEVHVRDAGAGLSEKTIHYISDVKEDPDWVREFRQRGGLLQPRASRPRTRRHLCWIDRGTEKSYRNAPELVRRGYSDWRQQIERAQQRRLQRRLLHLRAARRESETSAPGLRPD